LPQFRKAIIASINASKPHCIDRPNTFEQFGYDFMLDADLNVWLLEVNAAPSMAFSTVSSS